MTIFTRPTFLIALLATLILSVGCGGSKKKSSASGSGTVSSSDDVAVGDDGGLTLEINGDSDSGRAGALRTVNFDFNSAQLSSTTRSRLESAAAYLIANPSVEVQVEGHCDERGGVQYNIALGERRAQATKNYLSSLGVDSGRVTTISFGKERPLAFGHDELAWGKNRRANFVITAK